MADLVAELRRSGESVPSRVMKDLRSAKTMMEILKVDRSQPDHLLRTEEYLNSVESHLVPVAKRRLGEAYIDEWTKRIVEAQKTVQPRDTEPTARFPIGIPRDKAWARIEPSREVPRRKIEQFAQEEELDFKVEKDGYILIYGEEKSLKRFVRKTADLLRQKRGSSPKAAKEV